MRISTLEGDSSYQPWASLCEVTFNGVLFEGFTHADEERSKVFTFQEGSEDLACRKGEVKISFPEAKQEQFEDFYAEYLELRGEKPEPKVKKGKK